MDSYSAGHEMIETRNTHSTTEVAKILLQDTVLSHVITVCFSWINISMYPSSTHSVLRMIMSRTHQNTKKLHNGNGLVFSR
jgi:hypothetical protein